MRQQLKSIGFIKFTANMNQFLDTSYDQELIKHKGLTWLPWIGKDYSKSQVKTLILGESTYNWAKDDLKREEVARSIQDENHLRRVHQNNAIDFKGKSLYARNIEKAIFQQGQESLKNAHVLWGNVGYHNLVLRAMSTVKDRPKHKDYIEGWLTVLSLLEILSVDQCIMYGLEGIKIKSLAELCKAQNVEYKYSKIQPAVGRSYARVMNIQLKNKYIKILFIRHPSAYFSWNKWGAIMHDQLNLTQFTRPV